MAVTSAVTTDGYALKETLEQIAYEGQTALITWDDHDTPRRFVEHLSDITVSYNSTIQTVTIDLGSNTWKASTASNAVCVVPMDTEFAVVAYTPA